MWFSSWLRSRKRRGSPRQRPAFRPTLEALERRDVLSFSSPVAYSVLSQPIAVVATDINGDGKPDLITLDNNGYDFSVQLNSGNGAFGPAKTFPNRGQASAMAVGDVNGDGKLDIVLAIKGNNTVTELLGDGQGGFIKYVPNSYIYTPGNSDGSSVTLSSLALAHIYGSSEMDLVAVPAYGGIVYVARPLSGSAPGNGAFGIAKVYHILPNLTPSDPDQVAVGDLNGDGKSDVVVTNDGVTLGSVSVLLNNGAGALGTAQTYAVGGNPTAVAVGDVSGDGKIDIVTANSNGTASVLLNSGTGMFGVAHTYAVGGAAISVTVGDFNGDGKLDIVTTGAEMDILLNKGNGAFAAYQTIGPGGKDVVTGDFDGDGFLDLAQIDASGASIDVFHNKANW